jgi:DNA modification methylase
MIKLICGDALTVMKKMKTNFVNCIVTSPPYFQLRDYGEPGQMGTEKTPQEYVQKMVEVFQEARRVLKQDGTLWLNLGDSYNHSNKGGSGKHGEGKLFLRKFPKKSNGGYGLSPKNLLGIPWRVAFALQADGWNLRSDIIWHKTNPMPESVKDRPTRAHEYIFLFSKSKHYFYDAAAIKEPGKDPADDIRRMSQQKEKNKSMPTKKHNGIRPRQDKQRGHGRRHEGFNARWDLMSKDEQQVMGANKRDVWSVATYPFRGAHFATFPPKLIEPCVLAGCPKGGIVLDIFSGSGTTGLVCRQTNRSFIGIDISRKNCVMAEQRIRERG